MNTASNEPVGVTRDGKIIKLHGLLELEPAYQVVNLANTQSCVSLVTLS